MEPKSPLNYLKHSKMATGITDIRCNFLKETGKLVWIFYFKQNPGKQALTSRQTGDIAHYKSKCETATTPI